MPASVSASVIPQSAPVRMPASLVTSLCLHGAAFGLLIYTARQAAIHHVTNVNNVELMVQVKKMVAQAPPKAQARQQAAKDFNIFKMALPEIPHMAAPHIASVTLPEAHKMMQVQAPKLKDRGRLDNGPKLNMDLDKAHDSLDIAKVEARIPSRKLNALAAMPKLADIGRRRVANLPQAIAMEEKRQEALGLKGLGSIAAATSDHRAPAAVDTIQDASPDKSSSSSKFGQKIASLLPEQRLDMGHAAMPAVVKQSIAAPDAAPKRSAAKLQATESKKGVEIEGPLADRKVLNYEIPEFPSWAKDQGILEASVGIKFWVNKDGEVLPNMRVEHTSGYGQLDRLAMESLSKWKFAPLISEEKQWGIITFRFLLE